MLNVWNSTPLQYKLIAGADLTEESLYELFKEYSTDYEIDGLIIEINDAKLRLELGYETSTNNPCFARAYKADFEETAETEVIEIKRQISKRGYFKPVAVIKPVRLDGATVTNIYVDNERWILAYGIGKGTKLVVKRSGMVIPRIVKVEGVNTLGTDELNDLFDKQWGKVKIDEFKAMIGINPSLSKYEYPQQFTDNLAVWNETGVEIMLIEPTDEVQIQRNIAFFENIKTKGVSDGIITELYEKGFKSIKDILFLIRNKRYEIESWEGWGDKRAEILINSIQSALSLATLPQIMHASGFFIGLGSRKLELVVHFKTKPTFDQLVAVDGFSDISAKSYLAGYDRFWMFVSDAGIVINEFTKREAEGDRLKDFVCVFTKFRDKNMEDLITSNGGTIGSSVSRKTTHVIVAEFNGGSTKEEKAKELGIKIYDKAGFESYLKIQLGLGAKTNKPESKEPTFSW